jgi:hypothetical protein
MGWQSKLLKKYIFPKSNDAIKSVKIATDLKKRRADFEDVVKRVDKHKSPASPKIKYDAAKKISKIYDKFKKKD